MRDIGILAVIPARGGSARLPGKNIKPFNGKPLLAYSIEQAKASSFISRVVVATDDDDIGKIAREYGAEVVINPSTLHTGDEQGIIKVVNHTLAYLERYEFYKPLIIVLLQPTSPLRTTGDIDATIKLLLDTGSDSAVTECQGKENGAVYVSRRQVFTEQNKIPGSHLSRYVMPPERSVDIDTQEDFDLAERLLKDVDSRVLYQLDRPPDGSAVDKGSQKRRGRPRKVPAL